MPLHLTPHTRRRRGRTAAVGLAATVVLATGCSGGSDSGGSPPSDTLVAAQDGDMQRNFNPYSPTMLDGPGTIFEALFFYNAMRDDAPQPLLGTDFSWNDDGTVLSITTREDATWSDGEPFSAADVVFTLDLIAEHQGLNSIGYAGETELVDENSLTVSFPEPSYVMEAEVLGEVWIVPEHVWGEMDDPTTDVVREPVGTGPFVLESYTNQAFTLAANPDYWDGEPELGKIRYLALSGNQATASSLAAGELDWHTGPVPDIHNVDQNYPGYQGITVPLNQMVLMTCSSEEFGCAGPQTEPEVRRALYYGMDRTQLNALAFEDTATEISPGFVLPDRDAELLSAELEDPVAPMEADPDRAGEILEEAGYVRGGDGVYARDGERLSFTVLVPSGWTDYITAVNTMAEQLRDAGIELTAQQQSWNEWSDARGSGRFQLLIDALYPGPTPDPYYLYTYFFATENTAEVGETANPNFARYSYPDVDEALARLQRLAPEDTAARQEQYDAIQTRLEQDMPYVPILTAGTSSQFNAEKFTGWPSGDDLYATPAVWDRPDHAEIFKRLRPAGD